MTYRIESYNFIGEFNVILKKIWVAQNTMDEKGDSYYLAVM
jgi:hypothetical protein